jgi:hypothetical protein
MTSKGGGVKVIHRSSASGGGKGDANGAALEAAAAAGLPLQEQLTALQQEKAALQRSLARAEQVRGGGRAPVLCARTGALRKAGFAPTRAAAPRRTARPAPSCSPRRTPRRLPPRHRPAAPCRPLPPPGPRAAAG